jgi:hypothetical protein
MSNKPMSFVPVKQASKFSLLLRKKSSDLPIEKRSCPCSRMKHAPWRCWAAYPEDTGGLAMLKTLLLKCLSAVPVYHE